MSQHEGKAFTYVDPVHGVRTVPVIRVEPDSRINKVIKDFRKLSEEEYEKLKMGE